MGRHVQTVKLENGNLTDEINILAGRNHPPEGVVVTYQGNASLAGTETLDFYGFGEGIATVITAVIATQATVRADDVVKLDLSSAAKGCWKLRFTSSALTAGKEIDIAVVVW